MIDEQLLNKLDEKRAMALEKKKHLKKTEEVAYIKWLGIVHPKWTKEQVLQSAGKHFGKNFLSKKKPEVKKTKSDKKE